MDTNPTREILNNEMRRIVQDLGDVIVTIQTGISMDDKDIGEDFFDDASDSLRRVSNECAAIVAMNAEPVVFVRRSSQPPLTVYHSANAP